MKTSVVAGIYNPPIDLFKKFLDSCINSTLNDCEFILIQDSPDDILSNKLLKEYQNKFNTNKNSFIIITNKKNLGILPTYNIGLKQATGEYIAFFDSDDYFDIDFLEIMYNYAKNLDLDILNGYSITHFYEKTDDFLLNFMPSTNNDIWSNLFKRKTMVDYNIPYVDDPTIVFNSITSVMTPKVDILPLENSTFYHYMRHDRNISKYSSVDVYESIMDHLKSIEADIHLTKRKLNSFFESKGIIDAKTID